MERVILHCDLNNFYASVACHDHPELRNMPVAVCGDPKNRHGIVLAKNMAAKKCGVKTAEAIWQAKEKCPGLVTVLPEFERYSYFSQRARAIYEQYSDMVEPFGPDEAWIDVTGSGLIFGNGEKIANEIRNRMKQELGLTISVGVSFNKIFAKIGSDLKKPDAVTVISCENYKQKVWPLPAESMIGIGNSTLSKLHSFGIYTLEQLSKADENMLKRIFGKNGPQLKQYATGMDCSRVAPSQIKYIPKSIGRSTTYSSDMESYEDVWRVMLKLAEDVGSELRKYRLEAGGVQLHLRTNQLKVNEIQKPLKIPTQLGFNLAKEGFELFKRNYEFLRPLRSLGIRAINLLPEGENARQVYLFCNTENEIRLETIEKQMDTLRSRFGKDCICRGVLLKEKTPETAARPFQMMYK